MSLANLAINVNIGGADTARRDLRSIGDQAKASMATGGAAVDGFRGEMLQAANDVRAAAAQMGQGINAAADSIEASGKRAEAAIAKLNTAPNANKWRDFGVQASAAFGTAFGAGYAAAQDALQKTEDFVVAKTKAIGIGLAIGVVSATAAAVYTAYKVISSVASFASGLLTGESYKSANIDALSAQVNQAKELAAALRVSAQEGNATADALARLGVSRGDLTSAYDGATKAMRTNGDELDRLGVQYKAADGALLSQRQFLENAKKALDEYADGYDRSAAAAAIGAGSYDQITAALKITQAEVVASKARLDEFNLGIGQDTIAAEAAYQQAMRDFRNETKLTGDGFKRVIADSVLPLLTDLANFFKEGFPLAVNSFRVAIGSITAGFYALKSGIYVIAEGILGTLEAIGKGVMGVGSAVALAVRGDFSGATAALLGGYEAARARMAQIGSNIVAQVTNNNKAIAMAFGLDDRAAGAVGGPGSAAKGGKRFTPAPKPEIVAPGSATRSAYAAFLDDLDRQNKKAEESEYAMLRLKAAQLAAAEGITDLSGAYQRIASLQRADGLKVLTDFGDKLALQADEYKGQTDALNYTGAALEKFTMQLSITRDVENSIRAARKAGKPIDEGVVALLRMQAEAQVELNAALIDGRAAQERAFGTGVSRALRDYTDSATNAADNAKNLITGTLRSAEDAFIQLNKTGKLSIKDLFATFQEELLRQEFRKFAANGLGGGGFINTAANLLGSFFSGGSNFLSNMGFGSSGAGNLAGSSTVGMSLAVGMPWVPFDGFPATLHQGERVMTREENADYSSGGGRGVNVTNVFHVSGPIDSRTQAQIAASASRSLAIASARNN